MKIPSKDELKNAGNHSTTRWDQIKKSVVYSDCKEYVSAYDLFFYHFNFNKGKRAQSRQDFIRLRSKYLAKAIDGQDEVQFYGKNQIASNVILSEEVCRAVSKIMDSQYSEIRIITHRLYWKGDTSRPAKTIWIKKNGRNYSEAFAGTGESRIILIVNDVINASHDSLLLVDEPEISLHPKAIENLQEFLLEQVLKKKLQIVITTHSPLMIKNLPDDAIKYMSEDKEGIVHVNNETPYDQAFYNLQDEIDKPIKLYVEDSLTKAVVNCVIDKSPNSDFIHSKLNVDAKGGGADNIISKYIPISADKDESDVYYLLDGDQDLLVSNVNEKSENMGIMNWVSDGRLDLEKIPSGKINTDSLENIITKMVGCKISFSVSGGKQGVCQEKLLEQQKQFIKYWNKHVFFLNYQTPEKGIIDSLGKSCEKKDKNGKMYFKAEAHKRLGSDVSSSDILVLEREHLYKLNLGCKLLSNVNEIMSNIMNK